MNKKKLIVLGLLIVGYLTFLSPHRAWPTVSNTAVATTTGYGNGSNTSFPITFDFRSNSWLTVALHDTSTNPATVTQIPQQGGASGFSVTGGNPGTQIVMGTAPTLTQFLVISRAVPLTQGVAFNPASIFPYNGLSSQLDQITLALQNINVFGGPSTVSGSGGSGGGGAVVGVSPTPARRLTLSDGTLQGLQRSTPRSLTIQVIRPSKMGTCSSSMDRVGQLSNSISLD